ncbi:hypothetical protein M413DRAFT_29723 [Hebeloma cylindrosporum]|uniref:Uncharacterized protein n=1 Tax=Hebeloma cylindrosporum TaxID=76867 RepID=A0A0C3C6H1_HEBCY|nr:hypothetical protein M413DRAFT_29723 [Hebeloma cylindrosporum h7]
MASRSFFRPDKSAAQVKPQLSNRYNHPDSQDEMEVDDLLTPKSSNSAPQPGNAAQPPASPTPHPSQPTSAVSVEGTTRTTSVLSPGLSFTRTTTAGAKRDRETTDANDTPNKCAATSANGQTTAAGGSGMSDPTATGATAPNTQIATGTDARAAPAGGDPTPPIGEDPTPPIGDGGNNNNGETIYHQIGCPDLTGPNSIPLLPISVPPGPILTPATFSPPSKYQLIPRPDAGFPQVKGHTHETIRAHVDPATLRIWNEHIGPAVIAFSPSDHGEIDTPKVIIFRYMIRDCLRNPDISVHVPNLI